MSAATSWRCIPQFLRFWHVEAIPDEIRWTYWTFDVVGNAVHLVSDPGTALCSGLTVHVSRDTKARSQQLVHQSQEYRANHATTHTSLARLETSNSQHQQRTDATFSSIENNIGTIKEQLNILVFRNCRDISSSCRVMRSKTRQSLSSSCFHYKTYHSLFGIVEVRISGTNEQDSRTITVQSGSCALDWTYTAPTWLA